MQEIRVDLTQQVSTRLWNLQAFIGEKDVTGHVLDLKLIGLRGYLPSANRNYVNLTRQRSRSISYFLQYDMTYGTLPPQILVDAIRAYLTDAAPQLTDGTGYTSVVESDLATAETLSASMPAFLSIGGKMFRLNPESESPVQLKMLDRMRKAAVTTITVQREAMLAAAKREADIVMRQAQAERAEVDRDRTAFRAERANHFIIPEWLANYPVKRQGNGIVDVQLQFVFQPVEWSIHDFTWYENNEDGEPDTGTERRGNYRWAARDATPQTFAFWLKFNLGTGHFSLENAYMDPMGGLLPHASHDTFCCQPQGLPERIRDEGDLDRVRRAVQRTFSVVNLGSLLTGPRQWNADVKAFMPPHLMEWILEYRNEVYQDPTSYGATEIPSERGSQIWEANEAATEAATPRRRR